MLRSSTTRITNPLIAALAAMFLSLAVSVVPFASNAWADDAEGGEEEPQPAPVSQWVQTDDGAWNYYDATGALVTSEWVRTDGVWYYVDAEGTRLSGQWLKDDGTWYYLNDDGSMATGWVKWNGNWYWMKKGGALKTSEWVEVNGKWYYLKDNGRMKTGWLLYKNTWYYLSDKDGHMLVGSWVKSEGKWYWLKAGTGAMVKKTWGYIGGDWYWFTTKGFVATRWHQVGSYWYYFGESGRMRTGWQQLGGKWYWMDSNGRMVTKWHVIKGKAYYFGTDGAWQKNKKLWLGGTCNALIAAELEEHLNDNYYKGTRYEGIGYGSGLDRNIWPNGHPRSDGYVGMNCAGFVAAVVKAAGGDIYRIGDSYYGAANAGSWRNYIFANCTYYVYYSIADLVKDHKAVRGDIVYLDPNYGDCHLTIFWSYSTATTFKVWDQLTGYDNDIHTRVESDRIHYYLLCKTE